MDSPAAIPPAFLAKLKQEYEATYDTIRKTLSEHHEHLAAAQTELISSQSLQIFQWEKEVHDQKVQLKTQMDRVEEQNELLEKQEKQLCEQREQLRKQNEHLQSMAVKEAAQENVIRRLRERLAKVVESLKWIGSSESPVAETNGQTVDFGGAGEGNGKMPEIVEELNEKEEVGLEGIEALEVDNKSLPNTEENILPKINDLPLRMDKDLPPRPISTISSLINDINAIADEIEAHSSTDSYDSISPQHTRQYSTTGLFINPEVLTHTPKIPYFYNHKPSNPSRYSTKPLLTASQEICLERLDNANLLTAAQAIALGPIDDDGDESSNSSGSSYSIFQTYMGGRPRAHSQSQTVRSDALPEYLSPSIGPEGIHPLLRQPPPARDSSSSNETGVTDLDRSAVSTVIFGQAGRKETFIERFKAQNTISKHHHKCTMREEELQESDERIRTLVRMEAERRKAANFGAEDVIQRSGVVHSMTLSPEKPEFVSVVVGGTPNKPKSRLVRVETDGILMRVQTTEVGEEKRTHGVMRKAVRKAVSDVWKRGSVAKK